MNYGVGREGGKEYGGRGRREPLSFSLPLCLCISVCTCRCVWKQDTWARAFPVSSGEGGAGRAVEWHNVMQARRM